MSDPTEAAIARALAAADTARAEAERLATLVRRSEELRRQAVAFADQSRCHALQRRISELEAELQVARSNRMDRTEWGVWAEHSGVTVGGDAGWPGGEWWRGEQVGSCYGWTSDPFLAIRFCSRADARASLLALARMFSMPPSRLSARVLP